MFDIITLLLMGDDQHIGTAILLFNSLKGKKSSEILSDIIYHNLSYYLQIKLHKASKSLKSEIARIRTLTPDNISLEKRLASMINMPDNVKTYIIEKNNEIKSGENNYKLQMAINGLMNFPWKPKNAKNDFVNIKNSLTKSRNYLKNVASKLDKTVYGHENSKKMLIELVGKWIQNPESTGQVIGLVGPPGVGKTLLAKGISAALNIPLSIVGLGGMSDSADLIGHSFTYAGAQYGMIVRQMIKAGHWRSVLFFDEVDKVSKRNDTNEIYNTLIHITDPNMNQHFQDRFYSSSIEFDLSGVLIVFSYNDSSKLDPILLDRIKEINISAYSIGEKINIAQNYIMDELCQNIGFHLNKIFFDDATIRYIIEKYTLEAGVRELRRKIEQILLKLNIDRFYLRGPFKKLLKKKYYETYDDTDGDVSDHTDSKNNIGSYVEHKITRYEKALDHETLNKIFNLEFNDKILVDQELVHKYLEKPVMLVEKIHKNHMIGVINGLYATSVGMGGIVPIQIYKNYIGDVSDDINLKLKITGNQKQVMRESVICALTTAINILHPSIKNKIMENFPYGFHIHAPDGGTPKDGPSAGCAFTTAFVSTILGKKINKNVAMTGEIELTGKISKIGGLDTKFTGAKKAGVKTVYICEENKEDYEKIKKKNPELFGKNFEIKIIKHIIDIVTDPAVIIDVTKDDFDSSILSEYQKTKNNYKRKMSRKRKIELDIITPEKKMTIDIIPKINCQLTIDFSDDSEIENIKRQKRSEEIEVARTINKKIKFNLGQTLGNGSDGTVYEWLDLSEGKVIKIFEGDEVKHFTGIEEGDLMKKIGPEICPKIYNCNTLVDGEDESNYKHWIIMEKMQMDLNVYSQSNKLDIQFINQLEELITSMHKKGYYHGDLVAANVLVNLTNNDPIIKLTDFFNGGDISDIPYPNRALRKEKDLRLISYLKLHITDPQKYNLSDFVVNSVY